MWQARATTETGAAGIEEFFRDAGINGKGYVLDIRADESVADLNETLKGSRFKTFDPG